MHKRVGKPCYERAIALLGGLLFVYVMLISTKTIWSGYHFADDHELVRIEYSLTHGANLFEQVRAYIINDLNIRYRPLYWVERVVGTAVMGSDLFAWNVYKAVMGVITFYLLYMTGYYLRQKGYISFLFAAVIMVGQQITPWYRSANQENTGLLLCAVALYLTARQYYRQRFRHIGYNLLIAAAILLCSLEKESFVLMIPAFGAMKYWLEYTARERQISVEDERKGLWLKCLGSGAVTYLIIGIGFLANLYMLLFRVGVDKLSYAGFHKDISLRTYLWGIKYSLTECISNYVWFAVMMTLVVIVCCQVVDKGKLKYYAGFGLISCYVMGTQLIAHSKSLMWERYIIPFIIGYAALFVFVGYHMLSSDKLRRRVYALVLAALVLLHLPDARERARAYAEDGELIQEYLSYILSNTSEEDQIIGAYVDGEFNLAMECWLEVHGRKKMYAYNWSTGELKDEIHLGEPNSDNADWEAEVAVCYSSYADKVLELMGLSDSDQYLRQQYGQYAVIIRREE